MNFFSCHNFYDSKIVFSLSNKSSFYVFLFFISFVNYSFQEIISEAVRGEKHCHFTHITEFWLWDRRNKSIQTSLLLLFLHSHGDFQLNLYQIGTLFNIWMNFIKKYDVELFEKCSWRRSWGREKEEYEFKWRRIHKHTTRMSVYIQNCNSVYFGSLYCYRKCVFLFSK